MNKVQQKAYNWLISQNYNEKNIVFQARKTPDFLTSDGKGFEVKLLYGKSTIWFFDSQFDLLTKMKNTNIIVFDSINDTPILNISSNSMIKNSIINGIKIVSVNN